MSAVRKTRRKDLVVGLGATGLSIARYLARSGRHAIFCDTREAPPGLDDLRALVPDANVMLGDLRIPAGVARIIASPGVPASHPLFAEARKRRIEVVSDIELFADEAEAPFLAITGSNGKSTVTTLVALMCEAAGRQVKAGGNLGEPALDLLTGDVPDVYVLELSSFQLQRTAHLPAAVAVLLNISVDHLDWHADEAEYREAKFRVYGQATAAVYNREDAEAGRRAARAERTISFGLDEPDAGLSMKARAIRAAVPQQLRRTAQEPFIRLPHAIGIDNPEDTAHGLPLRLPRAALAPSLGLQASLCVHESTELAVEQTGVVGNLGEEGTAEDVHFQRHRAFGRDGDIPGLHRQSRHDPGGPQCQFDGLLPVR